MTVRVSLTVYFNPRPREEGDFGTNRGRFIREFISIHALVKRATREGRLTPENLVISIHALVKRATKTEKHFYHNPDISIHALVKRATLEG